MSNLYECMAPGCTAGVVSNAPSGATTGGFVRLNAEGEKWLKKFLAQGGDLCPECARLHKLAEVG